VGTKINGEFMPPSTPLKNGDRVEIITSESARPNPAWAHFAHTGKARAHIRSTLKNAHRHESEQLGEQLLGQAIRALGGENDGMNTLSNATESQWDGYQKESGRNRPDTLADIGLGKKLAFVVARQLLAKDQDALSRSNAGPMLIRGAEGIAVRLGKCCSPIPGDPIIGQIKKDHGLIIHTHDCIQVRHYREDPEKWVDVAWYTNLDKLFDVGLHILVTNQRGVLAKVAAAIADEGSDIDNVHMKEEAGAYSSLYFTVSVQNRIHLARLMRALRGLPEVIRLQRLKNKQEELHP
jgi:GTP pyrophosphokinase